MMRFARPTLALVLMLAAPAAADEIRRTDGEILADVEIVDETIQEVVYQQGGQEASVASEEVLSVRYSKLPRQLDEAESALADDDPLGALELLEEYVNDQLPRPRAREKWAPAWAAWRVARLRAEIGDREGMIKAAGRVVESFPDSRYLTVATLAKARAELAAGRTNDALSTVAELEQAIASRGLSRRWDLECQILKIVADSRTENAKRTALQQLADDAQGKFPSVRNRALVAAGETYLREADAAGDPARAKQFRGEALQLFRSVALDARGDDAILAGAHTGLGECLFFRGADSQNPDTAALQEALLEFLRVPVLYREEAQYVPKALFYAMRCFDLMGDRRRKRDMLDDLRTNYPDSPWVEQAARFDR